MYLHRMYLQIVIDIKIIVNELSLHFACLFIHRTSNSFSQNRIVQHDGDSRGLYNRVHDKFLCVTTLVESCISSDKYVNVPAFMEIFCFATVVLEYLFSLKQLLLETLHEPFFKNQSLEANIKLKAVHIQLFKLF